MIRSTSKFYSIHYCPPRTTH